MLYDSRENFLSFLLLDYIFLNDLLAGPHSQECLRKIGIKYGLRVEEQYRLMYMLHEHLSVKQFTNLIQTFLEALEGGSVIKVNNTAKITLSILQCPFKQMSLKSPAIYQVFVGIFGGIAARNFAYSKITLSIRPNDSQHTKLNIYYSATEEAAVSQGWVFDKEPTSYLFTRSEIQAIKEDMVNKSDYQSNISSLESLQTSHRELQMEYNQLRNEIFSDLRLGILTVNETGQITYMNQTASELMQKHTDSEIDKSFQKVMKETLLHKTKFNQHILQMRIKDENRFFSINTVPLFTNKDKVSGAVCVFQDVTEKRILENELLQMEKFSLVAELAAGTAHEIRNPMTTLRGFLQLLSKEFKPDEKGTEYCTLMIEEIDRANAIIKEFLLLTKPAAPKIKNTDLHTVLDEIFILIESKSLLENVELDKDYEQNKLVVHADPGQVKQVFLNLASNAIQAMPHGGKLKIATLIKDSKAIIRFTDTGHGIPEAQLLKIFDPFFTTKETGTGLGLTISYRIIESHGGRLSAESSVGKGTTFSVEIPLAAS